MSRTLFRLALGALMVCPLVSSVQGESSIVADCEGTINFGNTTASAITNFLTLSRLPVGSNFLVSLYYLPDTGVVPTDADFDQGTVLLPNAKIGPVPGVFVGGTRSTPATTPEGATAWFQVRVWESVFGTDVLGSYLEASAVRVPVGGRLPLLGRSGIVKVRTGSPCGVPPGVPASLRVQGFYIGTEGLEDHTPPVLNCVVIMG